MGKPNLEDIYGAGYLVDLFMREFPGDADTYSDAALAAVSVYRSDPPEAALLQARVGRMMVSRGLEHEVRYAAGLGVLDAVPVLNGQRLTL